MFCMETTALGQEVNGNGFMAVGTSKTIRD
jgi:hypothetical protein